MNTLVDHFAANIKSVRHFFWYKFTRLMSPIYFKKLVLFFVFSCMSFSSRFDFERHIRHN